jgi:Phage portal protein
MLDRIGDQLVLFRRAQEISRQQLQLDGALPPTFERAPLSPWATKRHLATIAWQADVFGADRQAPVTFQEAMRVPAIKKGRALLHSILCSTPLVAIRSVDGVDQLLTGKDAPTWLYRSDTDIAPEQRMAGLLDDIIFREASLLAVKRGAQPGPGQRGQILDAVHVPYEWWDVDDDGTLIVGDEPADGDQYVWIAGPSAGLLVEARAEIRQWLDISRNIAIRLASPVPSLILEDTDTGDLEDEEVEDVVATINESRRSPNGATMYVPNGLKATIVQSNDDSRLYIEARNALRIDIANHLNIPVALLDGSPATASLTYSTGEGKRSEFDDLSLDYWTTPLEAALSQDLVVPRSTRIRFDFSSRFAPTNAPTGAPTQD